MDEFADSLREVDVLHKQWLARDTAVFEYMDKHREQISGELLSLTIDEMQAHLRLVNAMTRGFVLATCEDCRHE